MEISAVRKSTKLIIDGTLYNTEEVEFMKPGKGRSVYRLKLKNLRDGSTIERTYRSGEKVEDARLNTQEAQYLYREGDHFIFMNTETFEDKQGYLKEGMIVILLMMGDEPIDVTLPTTVDLKVVETEVSTKTSTITAQAKSSVMETGIRVDTPAFIKEGDIIKVDTRSGTYVERVSTAK
jgi:elongation factor P